MMVFLVLIAAILIIAIAFIKLQIFPAGTSTPRSDWKEIARAVRVGTLVGVGFGLCGFILAKTPATAGMGLVMFFLVPFAAGLAVALVSTLPELAIAATLLATITSLVILIATAKEGLLCAFLAFPLLLAAMLIGALFGSLFRRFFLERSHRRTGTTGLMLGVLPLLILGAHRLECSFLDVARRETVVSTVRVPGELEQAWISIQSIDSIDARKPWLMHFGLPVPRRCTMLGSGIGAKRTCYFETGYIEETVTEWAPPRRMGLRIDRTNMPGRHWLGFETARYELRREGGQTILTRTTVITSHLYPVFYWRPLERLGVESEHEYILRDLVARMTPRAGK
jgi:hypothetical protein